MSSRYNKIDLQAACREIGIDLDAALVQLKALYEEVDARSAKNTAGLNLPCQRGCDMCCHDSVFLTPLEFFGVWNFVQENLDDETRDAIVTEGLRLYEANRAVIEALDRPPPAGAADHLPIVQELHFRCPMLGAQGECRVYPVRELYARLFGCSFNEQGGVYGCHLVGAHLAGKTVTLVRVRTAAEKLTDLPMTGKRQIYPYYLNLLYG